MTGIADTSGSAPPAVRVHIWAERAIVLGGFGVAALWTVADHALGVGTGFAGPLWTIAVAWAVAFPPSPWRYGAASGIGTGPPFAVTGFRTMRNAWITSRKPASTPGCRSPRSMSA